MTPEVFAGIDLHSNNVMIGIVDERGHRLKHQKLGCDLNQIASFLEPWKPQLKSVAVESTYNWYWLVDGLMGKGHRVHLANTAAIQQYNGLEYTDDDSDARWLAHMLRLGSVASGLLSIRNKSGRCAIFCAREANWSDKRPPIC